VVLTKGISILICGQPTIQFRLLCVGHRHSLGVCRNRIPEILDELKALGEAEMRKIDKQRQRHI
jgi:hypothetical protein